MDIKIEPGDELMLFNSCSENCNGGNQGSINAWNDVQLVDNDYGIDVKEEFISDDIAPKIESDLPKFETVVICEPSEVKQESSNLADPLNIDNLKVEEFSTPGDGSSIVQVDKGIQKHCPDLQPQTNNPKPSNFRTYMACARNRRIAQKSGNDNLPKIVSVTENYLPLSRDHNGTKDGQAQKEVIGKKSENPPRTPLSVPGFRNEKISPSDKLSHADPGLPMSEPIFDLPLLNYKPEINSDLYQRTKKQPPTKPSQTISSQKKLINLTSRPSRFTLDWTQLTLADDGWAVETPESKIDEKKRKKYVLVKETQSNRSGFGFFEDTPEEVGIDKAVNRLTTRKRVPPVKYREFDFSTGENDPNANPLPIRKKSRYGKNSESQIDLRTLDPESLDLKSEFSNVTNFGNEEVFLAEEVSYTNYGVSMLKPIFERPFTDNNNEQGAGKATPSSKGKNSKRPKRPYGVKSKIRNSAKNGWELPKDRPYSVKKKSKRPTKNKRTRNMRKLFAAAQRARMRKAEIDIWCDAADIVPPLADGSQNGGDLGVDSKEPITKHPILDVSPEINPGLRRSTREHKPPPVPGLCRCPEVPCTILSEHCKLVKNLLEGGFLFDHQPKVCNATPVKCYVNRTPKELKKKPVMKGKRSLLMRNLKASAERARRRKMAARDLLGVDKMETTSDDFDSLVGQGLFADAPEGKKRKKKTPPIPVVVIDRKPFNDSSFVCKLCYEIFPTEWLLISHRISRDCDSSVITSPTNESDLYSKLFKCDECTFMSRNVNFLNAHKENHTKGINFECYECCLMFESDLMLKSHEEHFHNNAKEYECGVCIINVRKKTV